MQNLQSEVLKKILSVVTGKWNLEEPVLQKRSPAWVTLRRGPTERKAIPSLPQQHIFLNRGNSILYKKMTPKQMPPPQCLLECSPQSVLGIPSCYLVETWTGSPGRADSQEAVVIALLTNSDAATCICTYFWSILKEFKIVHFHQNHMG